MRAVRRPCTAQWNLGLCRLSQQWGGTQAPSAGPTAQGAAVGCEARCASAAQGCAITTYPLTRRVRRGVVGPLVGATMGPTTAGRSTAAQAPIRPRAQTAQPSTGAAQLLHAQCAVPCTRLRSGLWLGPRSGLWSGLWSETLRSRRTEAVALRSGCAGRSTRPRPGSRPLCGLGPVWGAILARTGRCRAGRQRMRPQRGHPAGSRPLPARQRPRAGRGYGW